MLVIRFLRIGKKHQPFFRIVVCPKENPPKSGEYVENVGFFNPQNRETNLKEERIKYWLNQGAQPSDRVHNLLVKKGVIEGKKIAVHQVAKKKEKEKKEEKPPSKPKKEKEKPEKEKKKEPKEKKKSPKKPSSEKQTKSKQS